MILMDPQLVFFSFPYPALLRVFVQGKPKQQRGETLIPSCLAPQRATTVKTIYIKAIIPFIICFHDCF